MLHMIKYRPFVTIVLIEISRLNITLSCFGIVGTFNRTKLMSFHCERFVLHDFEILAVAEMSCY